MSGENVERYRKAGWMKDSMSSCSGEAKDPRASEVEAIALFNVQLPRRINHRHAFFKIDILPLAGSKEANKFQSNMSNVISF